ncbi:alpha/beta hydrolase [Sporosarcina trichiuri]|uniref:alpha/beta hydrolase n=1 Tax=Sporosarcina trichiuri TaxID=3056445 RepID=UPI0025B323E7|nr:alpha/beta hydrolase [Sporosarcina sp. 0.2-SM1T-5]WJY28270.1 alpha/beta hydrolase [Sporosarcina sp. 0.2-SM1T-5]
MKLLKNHWKKIIVGVIALFVLIQLAGGIFFYDLAIKRGPKEFLQNNADLDVADESMDLYLNGDWTSWVADQDFEQLTMTSRDGIELNGYFLPAAKPSGKLVILTHGYLGNAKQMGLFGMFYYQELGYNLFMPDARGHGKSGGTYYGFGWPDRLDLIDWTDLLVGKLGQQTEIVYHGLSMGAATVLMASGEQDLPKQVKAIVADSPYGSVYQLFAYQMDRMFHLPAFPLLDSTSLITKLRAGYFFREASAFRAVRHTDVPILYIHGDSDTFVPLKNALELYNSTASSTELLVVEGANHGESYAKEPELYKEKVEQFLGNLVE